MSVATWVPFCPTESERTEANLVAIDWLNEECRRRKSPALVITNTAQDVRAVAHIREFAIRHPRTTRLASRGYKAKATTPILVYAPTSETLGFAAAMVEHTGMPICVLEGATFSVRAWAAELTAVDLTKEIDSRIMEGIHYLCSAPYPPNGGSPDRVRKILREMRSLGMEDLYYLQLLAVHGMPPEKVDWIRQILGWIIESDLDGRS